LTEGSLDGQTSIYVTVESDQLVVFGDGVESDFVVASWGQSVRIHEAPVKLRLVR
jgi:hypothetical protein